MDISHLAVSLATLAPATTNGSPLGRFGPIVATIVATSVVLAALTVHLAAVFGQGTGTDPFIDSAALLVIGVVLGASALGSQAQQAHDSAAAANRRLDQLGAPQATDGEG